MTVTGSSADPRAGGWRRWARRVAIAAAALVGGVAVLGAAGWIGLLAKDSGTLDPAARGNGHDAEWLGHAWVDGRRTQSDVDQLAAMLRGSGIHDLFVHAGPFRDDGTLDPARRPRARWLTGALHTALPGVRVQAWLGAHPVPGQLSLGSTRTRAAIINAIDQVLDDGFDGVHLDFEPVEDGDANLVTMLAAAHEETRQRGAILSLSASLLAPVPGLATVVGLPPGAQSYWSTGYLRQLANHVDQVALMAYDTWLPTSASYSGYVRILTALALDAVPADVGLLIGVPAYHEDNMRHHPDAETTAAALRGVRLALAGPPPTGRDFGVALYVDFTLTADDWASYLDGWASPAANT